MFSPNGGHLASIVEDSNGTQRVFEDGKAMGGAFTKVSDLMFSPNGEHLAFVGENAAVSNGLRVDYTPDSFTVIVDGKTVGTANGGIENPTFSPNSEKFTYVEENLKLSNGVITHSSTPIAIVWANPLLTPAQGQTAQAALRPAAVDTYFAR